MSRHIQKQVQAAHAEVAFWRDFVESTTQRLEPEIEARLGCVRNLAESKLEALQYIETAYIQSNGTVCGVASPRDTADQPLRAVDSVNGAAT